VLFAAGRIVGVGPGAAAQAMPPRTEIIDAAGCAVLPGLINAHSHLYMTFGRTLGYDQPFEHWLPTQKTLIAQLSEEDFATCVTLGLLDNLRSGNTCIVDNLAVPAASENRLHEAAIRAAGDLGVRYVLARGYTDQFNSPEYLETPAEIDARMRRLATMYHGSADGRVEIMLSPMLPWALSREGFRLTRRLANELGLRIHMHTAETAGFAPLIEKAYGFRSNIRVYQEGGCLGPDVQLLGCAFLEPDELEVVRATRTPVILDPVAPMYLGAGIAPIRRLLGTDVPIGLGTNGPAANGGQDLFESMKTVVGLAKSLERDAFAFPQERVLETATIEGARALGLDDRIGSLEPGKRGDVIVVDLDHAHAAPMLNVTAALVFSCKGRDVRDVLIEGRVVVRNRRVLTADEPAVARRAFDAARGAVLRAGLAGRLTPGF
jgi:5-methylthioadenosine/S-adenosylhomocysteine deaminase